MATTIENFIVKVATQGVDKLDQIASKAESASRSINGLTSALLGVGFGAFIMNAIEAADAIADLSDATGISLESIKSFQNSLEIAGGRSKNFERAINTLLASIESANDGSLKTRDAFKAVGVSLDMLRNASEQGILDQTIKGLADMAREGKSASEIAATGSALMGRAFRGVDVQKFFQAYVDGKASLQETVTNIQAMADANAQLEKTYRTLQEAAGVAILPILEAVKNLNLSSETATKLIVGVGVALGFAFGAQTLANIIAVTRGIVGAAAAANLLGKNPIIKLLAGGAVAILGAAGAWGAYEAAMSEVTDAQKKLNEEAKKSPTVNPPEGPANRPQQADPRQKAAQEANKRILQLEQDTARYREGINAGLLDTIKQMELQTAADISKAVAEIRARENLTPELKRREEIAKTAELEAKLAYDIAKVRADASRQATEQYQNVANQTYELANQLAVEKALLGASAQARDIARANLDISKQQIAAFVQLQRIQNLDPELKKQMGKDMMEYFEIQKRLKTQIIEVQNSFETGWGRAFASYMDNATNAAKMAENTFNAMTSNLNRAIDDFVDNGKFSFKDFTNSVLRDMAKIQMKAAAANILSAGGSLLSGLFSGRAIGGPVQANEPYVVGERGPELFVPATAGSIMPNNKMSSGTGGSTIVQYNISAVDALSFKQMIARDPTFLYAVAEQGRKSLPLTRR